MKEKYVVVQGATLQCKFSVDPYTDILKVKSQNKHFSNDNKTQKKLTASTKDIGQTLEKNSFVKCKNQPTQNDYLPCQVDITEWKNFYEKVTLSNKGKILLEDSTATCPKGGPGCIFIVKHGQKTELSEDNFMNADPVVHNQINPFIDIEAFQNELTGQPEAVK